MIKDAIIYSIFEDPVAQQGERHLDRVEVVSSSLSGIILKPLDIQGVFLYITVYQKGCNNTFGAEMGQKNSHREF